MQALNATISQLYDQFDHPLIKQLSRKSPELIKQLQRAYQVTDAFNNLERKHPTEQFELAKVINDALRICHYRLVKAGIYTEWHGEGKGIELFSDAGLLLNMLTNILMNACNACEHYQPPKGIVKRLFWQVSDDKYGIALVISNNGPTINLEDQEKIFSAGFTRRDPKQTQGHGQGLYLCQQIAQYLGGQITLLTTEQLLVGASVGFKIVLQKRLPEQKEIG